MMRSRRPPSGIGDGLFHHGRVDRHALGAVLVDGTRFLADPDRLSQQPFDTFLADPAPPAGQRGRIDRHAVLEKGLARQVLVIRVLDPARDHRLIRQPVGVLEIQQPSRPAAVQLRAAPCQTERTRPIRVRTPPSRSTPPVSPTRAAGRSCRQAADAADHLVRERAGDASWAKPKLQGFAANHTKPCGPWREESRRFRLKSMRWGLFRANYIVQ